MILSLVRRDFVGKYKKSFLGFLWTFVDPLLQLLVYTLVFTTIMPMKGIDKFYLHLFVALIPWAFFSSCLTGGCAAIINQQDMVKKIYFPREVLPIAYVTSQFVNMLFSFIVDICSIIYFWGRSKARCVAVLTASDVCTIHFLCWSYNAYIGSYSLS